MTIFYEGEGLRNAWINVYESWKPGEVEYGVPREDRSEVIWNTSPTWPPIYRINVKLKEKAS